MLCISYIYIYHMLCFCCFYILLLGGEEPHLGVAGAEQHPGADGRGRAEPDAAHDVAVQRLARNTFNYNNRVA